MGARWISAKTGGRAPFLVASFNFARVCVLLRKTRRRRLPEDGIKVSPSSPRSGGASSTVGGCVEFYDKLKELFSGSSTGGSFMQDPFSAAKTDNDDKVKDDMMNDMSTFDEAKGPTGHDSDKLDTDSDDCEAVAALAATDSQVSSSNVAALKPNKKSFKKSAKPNTLPPPQNDKAKKSKPRSSQASQDDTDMDVLLTSTWIDIQETLASPVQAVAPKDPNAPLWDMLKKIPLPPDERMSVGMHLCKPEFAIHRGFVVSMGQEYMERWVDTYLSDNYPAGKRVGDYLVGNQNNDHTSNLGDDPVVNSSPF
uniref:Uncharacterized protein n=1 Tax=Aegilops tauschii TaxID=37682 RepID=M8B7I9_AEGTA